MLGLTKLVSSSFIGLSASGLGLYFIPKYFEDDSQPSTLIYKQGKSISDAETTAFEREEESNLNELNTFHEQFQQVFSFFKGKKSQEYALLQTIFQKVDITEEELKRLYEGNRQFFEQLRRVGETIAQKKQEKLTVEAELKRLEYFNESMKKTNEVMKQWKDSFHTIICAIDGNISTCSNSAPTPQASKSSDGGGHSIRSF